METWELIATILGSSVISTLIAAWFNIKIHNRNYKKEYYKKILDKRIAAYEKVIRLNSKLGTYIQTPDHLVHAHFSSHHSIINFCNETRGCINDSLWLGEEVGTILTELNSFIINEFDNNINPADGPEKRNTDIQAIARRKQGEINGFKERLKSLVARDIKNLHRIERFFDKPNGKKSFRINNRNQKD